MCTVFAPTTARPPSVNSCMGWALLRPAGGTMQACVVLAMMLLGAAVGAQAGAQAGGQATFYDILKADPSHKLIMRAVDSDPAGKLKALLQQQVPITAFVPTDSAFIKMAMKMRSVKNLDSGSVMKNHCLIAAILKQHMVPGVFDTTQLLAAPSNNRPSMLVTKKLVPNTKGQVSVSWPLKITKGAGGDVHIASAAQIPEPGNPSRKIAATTGTLVSPMNVRASNGMLHNINGLLLPMTDIQRLMKMTNCPKT